MAPITLPLPMQDAWQYYHVDFVVSASRYPDRIALHDPDNKQRQKWTYKELDDVTNRLADHLQKAHHVKANDPVVILMDRCAYFVIGMIGVLKAKGCFVHLEPTHPRALVQNVLTDCSPKCILSTSAFADVLGDTAKITELSEQFFKRLGPTDFKVREDLVDPNRRFFITMSSGTTGLPKGIIQMHRSAAVSFKSRLETKPYSDIDDNVEACNVFFIWEALRPFLVGAQCLIVPDSIIYDMEELPQYLQKYKVTNMLFTPSLFCTMALVEGVAQYLESLRFVVFCGEVVNRRTYELALEVLPQACTMYNLYSISEAFDVSAAIVRRGEAKIDNFLRCGQPLQHAKVMILDSEMKPCPSGVAGEVYVGGLSLSCGYLGREELTQKKFTMLPRDIMNQTHYAGRLYRTGDVGYIIDNELVIEGRCDSMVKIRGYSVELEAIRAALNGMMMIKDSVVIADGDPAAFNKTLVAYVVLNDVIETEGGEIVDDTDSSPTVNHLVLRRRIIDFLKGMLPVFSIPSVYIPIDSLPVNGTSGKLNTKELPDWKEIYAKQLRRLESSREFQQTPMEKRVSSIVIEVLDLPGESFIETSESFFELGGQSLSATQYLGLLRKELKPEYSKKLELHHIFKHPTIKEMAHLLDVLNSGRQDDAAISSRHVNLMGTIKALTANVHVDSVGIRTFWRNREVEESWATTRSLITGATGWVGAHILQLLLLTRKDFIYCIVRESESITAKDRLEQSLISKGILGPDKPISQEMFDARVRVIAGRIEQADLGFGNEEYEYLATRIDIVVHAAAVVNLLLPFSAMRLTNVEGTANILRFCNHRNIKQMHYISTNGVIPVDYYLPHNGIVKESDRILEGTELLDCGYTQTKWVAEQLVRAYLDKALPGVIYRLGNVAGSTRSGHWNEEDATLSFLKLCVASGSIPIESEDMSLEMTPVDFITRTIVKGIDNIRRVSGRLINIVSPHKIPLATIGAAFEHLNIYLRATDSKEWLEALNHGDYGLKREHAAYGLPGFLETMFSKHVEFELEGIQLLHGDDVEYPQYTVGKCVTMLKKLISLGHLQTRMGRPQDLPMLNRLMVVTGASSGIGQAVALSLHREGASVILVARRKQRLEELKVKMMKLSRYEAKSIGSIYIVNVDVTEAEKLAKGIKECEKEDKTKVYGLVACAGVMHYTPTVACDPVVLHKEVDINCKGLVNSIAGVLPTMKKRNRGHIVCISSDAGIRAFDGLAVYSGTKAFVEFYCDSLRREVAPYIRVTCVAPGDVDTELLDHNHDTEAAATYGALPTATKLMPGDIADAVVFAVTRSDRVSVNRILIEPNDAPI